MTIGYAVDIRNGQLDYITTFLGGGARLHIYDGIRPATTGGAVTTQTLLANLECGTPFAPASAAGELEANPVTTDPSADNSGTASWFRVTKADGVTFGVDGDAGMAGSGAELTLVDTVLIAGQPVDLASLVITRGNP